MATEAQSYLAYYIIISLEHIPAAQVAGQVSGRRMVATTIPAYHPTRTMAAEAHTYLAWVVPVGEPGAGYKNHTYLRAR